jgi:hypothetical protein
MLPSGITHARPTAGDIRVKRARQTRQPGKGAKAREARSASRSPGVSHHPPRPGLVTQARPARQTVPITNSGQKATAAPWPGKPRPKTDLKKIWKFPLIDSDTTNRANLTLERSPEKVKFTVP